MHTISDTSEGMRTLYHLDPAHRISKDGQEDNGCGQVEVAIRLKKSRYLSNSSLEVRFVLIPNTPEPDLPARSRVRKRAEVRESYEATSCNCLSRSLISSLSFAAYSNLRSSAASIISAWRSAMRFWSSPGSRGASRAVFLWAL
jgi:hypothetical protein